MKANALYNILATKESDDKILLIENINDLDGLK